MWKDVVDSGSYGECCRSFGGIMDCSSALPVVVHGEDYADMSLLCYTGAYRRM